MSEDVKPEWAIHFEHRLDLYEERVDRLREKIWGNGNLGMVYQHEMNTVWIDKLSKLMSRVMYALIVFSLSGAGAMIFWVIQTMGEGP